MSKRILHCLPLLFLLLLNLPGYAQHERYGWQVGAYGGLMNYSGDLTDRFRIFQPTERTITPLENVRFKTYGASVEKSLGKSWGLGLLYSRGEWTATDRAIDWNGDLQTGRKNFGRSLNALTKVQDLSLLFTLYTDNGSLLPKGAFFSPYLQFGGGLTWFEVYGDLYHGDEQDQRYYYWDDGSVRNLPPGDPAAKIIEPDGIYETYLPDLQTEGEDYSTTTFQLSGGIGFKFRLAKRWSLNLAYLVRFTQSDYLDDLSGPFLTDYTSAAQEYAANPADWPGEYRGDPDGGKDLYTFATVSAHFHFGYKKNAFTAPAIITGGLTGPQSANKAIEPAAPEPRVPSPLAERVDSVAPTATAPQPAREKMQLPGTSPDSTLDARLGRIEQALDELRQPASEPVRIVVEQSATEDLDQLSREVTALRTEWDAWQTWLADSNRREPDQLEDLRRELSDLRREQAPAQPPAAAATPTTQSASASAEYLTLAASIEALRTDLRRPVAEPGAPNSDSLQSQIDTLRSLVSQLRTRLAGQDSLFTALIAPDTTAETGAPIKKIDPQMAALQAQILSLQTQLKEAEERPTAEVEAELKALREEVAALKARPQSSPRPAEEPSISLAEKIRGQARQVVYFSIGSTAVQEQGQTTLQGVAKLMDEHPALRVELAGYADPSGNTQANKALARRRAMNVRNILIEKGISGKRIVVQPGGIDYEVSNPVEGRRVEIALLVSGN